MAKKEFEDIEKLKLILSDLTRDYQDVFVHSRSIDTKVGLIITFLIAMLPLYIDVIGVESLSSVIKKMPNITQLECCFVIFSFFSMLLYVVSFLFSVLTIWPKPFYKIDTNVFANEKFSLNDIKQFSNKSLYFSKIVEFSHLNDLNTNSVNKKGVLFRFALSFSLAFSLFIIVVFIFKLFVI